MKTITEQEAVKNTTLEETVQKDSQLKTWLVDYVGINSEEYVHDNEITVQMIVDVVAKEFPEFLMAVAEENWVRGYHQALEDVDDGMKLLQESREEIPEEQWTNEYREHAKSLNVDHE
jgi:hypothetical protein